MAKTYQQAIAERHAKHATFNAKIDKRVAKETRIANLLQANPQVGTLSRNGKTVYYTFPAGGSYREAARIETLIGGVL